MKIMDGVLLHKLFQLIEEERQDKKLIKLLEHTIATIFYRNGSLDLGFSNGEHCKISSDMNDYRIVISDPLLYQNGDDADSKMSIDRVLLYLNVLGQYKYEEL